MLYTFGDSLFPLLQGPQPGQQRYSPYPRPQVSMGTQMSQQMAGPGSMGPGTPQIPGMGPQGQMGSQAQGGPMPGQGYSYSQGQY